MTAVDALARLGDVGVLPVVVIDDAERAAGLARDLADGGVPCAEVTFRTPAAADAIRAMAEVPGFLVGAGTVLTPEQVDVAVAAGAAFVVSPGLDDLVATRAAELGVPYVPGVATATEVMRARAAGFAVQKLFPAAQLGGAPFVAALAGPFSDMSFVPSGGVALEDAASYRLPSVLAVSTSWIAPRADVAAGRRDVVERARDFRRAVRP